MSFYGMLRRKGRSPAKQKVKQLPRKERHKAWKEQKREERDLTVTIKRRRQLEDMETKRMKKEKERRKAGGN